MALNNLGIRARILLSTLVPAAIMAILLGGYLTRTQLNDLHESQRTLGQSLARQLVPASEYGLFTRNTAALQSLADSYMVDEQIAGIVIRDAQGAILARAGLEKLPAAAANLAFIQPVHAGSNSRGSMESLLTEQPATEARTANTPALLGTVTINLSSASISARSTEILADGAIIVTLALFAMLLLNVVVSRSVTRPLQVAIAAIRRFGKGNLNARVKSDAGGELGELASGINDMATIVQNAQERLQEEILQATKELQETLEAVEVKNVELDLARKRALTASQVKSEFLANMSHEIRTPMNAIVGFTRLLEKTPLDADQQDYLHTISESAETLLKLLEDVLNLSRIEAGRLTLETEIFSPVTCADSVLGLIAEQAYKKKLELVFHHTGALPESVRGDAGKMRQILLNLLHNAVKFTDTGNITLTIMPGEIEEKRLWLKFTVTDTGPGISQEQKDLLFQPFAQLENTATKLHGGAGLGLAICQRLSVALGGRLTLENLEPVGSVFTLHLPFDLASSLPAQAAPDLAGKHVALYDNRAVPRNLLAARLQEAGMHCWATEQLDALLKETRDGTGKNGKFDIVILALDTTQTRFGDNLHQLWRDAEHPPVLTLVNSVDKSIQRRIARSLDCKVLPQHASFTSMQQALSELLDPAAADAATQNPNTLPTLDGRKILVVEDNRINARLITEMLLRLDATPQVVETGQAAILSLDANPPDAILLDLHLPDMDGLAVAREMRASRVGSQLRIYALTASSDPALARAARDAGVDDVLVKPVDESQLARLLATRAAGSGSNQHETEDRLLNTPPALPDAPLRAMLQKDLPAILKSATLAAAQQDYPALAAAAHQLSGTAAFCKLPGLLETASHLEKLAAEQKHGRAITGHITRLEKEINSVLAVLAIEDSSSPH